MSIRQYVESQVNALNLHKDYINYIIALIFVRHGIGARDGAKVNSYIKSKVHYIISMEVN